MDCGLWIKCAGLLFGFGFWFGFGFYLPSVLLWVMRLFWVFVVLVLFGLFCFWMCFVGDCFWWVVGRFVF